MTKTISHNQSEGSSQSPSLSPQQVRTSRARIQALVTRHLNTAEAVLDGKKHWTPSQVALFRALLNKAVPDISASISDGPGGPRRSVTGLMREELEALAFGDASPAEGDDGPEISTTYEELSPGTAPRERNARGRGGGGA